MKVLYFERGGYCLWSKRLEQGCYQVRFDGTHKTLLDPSALTLIIEGIDTASVRRFKRYRHPRDTGALIAHPV
jgi:transposase